MEKSCKPAELVTCYTVECCPLQTCQYHWSSQLGFVQQPHGDRRSENADIKILFDHIITKILYEMNYGIESRINME